VTVGVLLITHGDIGAVLLKSALNILPLCPLPTLNLKAPPDCDPERVLQDARRAAGQLDSGDGVLVLTDVYGATPSNIACRLGDFQRVRVVSGVNLPMLLRVLNYPDLKLDELAAKAISGGRDGVLTCAPQDTSHAE
jgi:PTS system ascorbate-specific IIA component